MTPVIASAYGIAFALFAFVLAYLLFKKFVKGGGIKYDGYRKHGNREHEDNAQSVEQRDISTKVREDIVGQSDIPKASAKPVVGEHPSIPRPKRKCRLVIRKSRSRERRR